VVDAPLVLDRAPHRREPPVDATPRRHPELWLGCGFEAGEQRAKPQLAIPGGGLPIEVQELDQRRRIPASTAELLRALEQSAGLQLTAPAEHVMGEP
jgi:hypothetical protein